MSLSINVTEHIPGQVAIGNVDYGTIITGVAGAPNSVYIKVKKRSCGAGVELKFKDKCSVLINIQYGTMRQIPGGQGVNLLDGTLDLRVSDCPERSMKGDCL